ncbi:MAG TPA: citrate (Si)-synthase [candidate division Zixibacteria bacterium]|nr:citrate (Si)-synthase [candidate division Zixibacteria bacterium]HER00563.1 citrate (Si)-synthase [candidate division Zixibacteria bacterium]
MASLKEKFASKIPVWGEDIKKILKEKGDVKISDVSVQQAYGGMRGVKGMICDTSLVEPDKGLIIRGIPILELTDKLPEEIFFLLLSGDMPTDDDVKDLQDEYKKRGDVPKYVWDVLKAMPKTSHPMAMFDTAVLVLENESIFRKRYAEGIPKGQYWDAVYEDGLNLLAKLPAIGAGVYRMKYDKGGLIDPDPKLSWGANFAHMMGIDDETFYKAMELYFTLHCDHEGGNVSAFSCHTIASALSDPYYAVSGGLNGLAGPLHGLANQECLKWVLEMMDKLGGGIPTKDQIKDYAWETLNAGKVIPGYGHAVLRVTDPRYTAFLNFGKEHLPDSEVLTTVARIYEVVPDVLKEHGKAKNPWPNVDAGSGAILYHYGITEFEYYTVLFSISRAMGMVAQQVWNRAMMIPITRPKSVGTDWIKKQVGM